MPIYVCVWYSIYKIQFYKYYKEQYIYIRFLKYKIYFKLFIIVKIYIMFTVVLEQNWFEQFESTYMWFFFQ